PTFTLSASAHCTCCRLLPFRAIDSRKVTNRSAGESPAVQSTAVKRSSVKDLRARSNILIVLLAVAALVGCQSLNATRPSSQQNSAEVVPAVSHLEFGSVVVGYKQLLSNIVINRTNSPVTITTASVDQSDFSISDKQFPVTLAAGESTTVGVMYQPKAHGTSTGTVTLADATSSTSTSFTVSGSSSSPGQLTVSASSINF